MFILAVGISTCLPHSSLLTRPIITHASPIRWPMRWKLHLSPSVVNCRYFRFSKVSRPLDFSLSRVTIVLSIKSIFKLALGA
jgi:hypothetical protein